MTPEEFGWWAMSVGDQKAQRIADMLKAAILAERERCAKIVRQCLDYTEQADRVIAAIRALKDKP